MIHSRLSHQKNKNIKCVGKKEISELIGSCMVTNIYWLHITSRIEWYKYDDNISYFDITIDTWIVSSFEHILCPTMYGPHCRQKF